MRINEKTLSIPPYLSTSWDNISALKTKESPNGFSLFVTLFDGTTTEVPNISKPVIEEIFEAHERFLDKGILNPNQTLTSPPVIKTFGTSFKLGLPGFESLKSVLQHNQNDYASPDLPSDVLDKISELTQMMSPMELDGIPNPEPHCNCPHCQITRAMKKGKKPNHELSIDCQEPFEEIVLDEELQFKSWEIKQIAENLYEVSNPLDPQEQYSVFLGSPIGCTCGHKDCEHIKAVLKS